MFVISKQTLELNKFLHLYVQMRPFTFHVQKINLICLQNEFIERRISKRSKKSKLKKMKTEVANAYSSSKRQASRLAGRRVRVGVRRCARAGEVCKLHCRSEAHAELCGEYIRRERYERHISLLASIAILSRVVDSPRAPVRLPAPRSLFLGILLISLG